MELQTYIQGEDLSMQSFRALIGWVNDQEGIKILLGRIPSPTDDLANLQQTIVDCHAAVASRPIFTPVDPIVNSGDDPLLRAVKAKPEINTAFASTTWFPAMVNLKEVLAFQKMINTEGLATRLAEARTNREELFELCLPTNQPLPPTGAITDTDGKGFTLSALNPNLRVLGTQVSNAHVNTVAGSPPLQALALSFFVTMGASYLVVVRYKDRYFVRDGYHRAVGLLREGIDVAPCIVIDAHNFEQDVVLGQPQAFLPYEVLYGPHPPRLVDFWDESVSFTVLRPAIRKVIRLRGDEFVVQG